MRFSPFIKTIVAEVAKNQGSYDKMRNFSHPDFKDGWEIWLQCEAFDRLPDSKQYECSRGNPYPVPFNKKKCDFLLSRKDLSLWLELKVLLKQDMADLVDRFADDLNKIDDIKLPYESNSVGAFAVIPLKASELFSQEIKDRFKERSQVKIESIDFLAVKPGVSNLDGTYNSHQKIGDDRIVILYYARI